MNLDINNLNKAFENRVRFAIMSLLMVEETMNFNSLKESLKLSDGNLASHLKALEKEEYIEVIKGFVGRKTNTDYKITKLGNLAFQNHLLQIEKIISQIK
ncbi:MAG TPA: transcriptional regulator [Saprospiraceae bacterium]|nr:transcriptional regulator [Saprospiraceae bacterium]HPK10205.1 transcriptional regulator [Saprospiraceae bacterium]HPQ20677.1 transcriptional regulator [Saprospiraceae bacterium]HRX29684.1 transcriptional regulator [Saprospiraceae bacterium]